MCDVLIMLFAIQGFVERLSKKKASVVGVFVDEMVHSDSRPGRMLPIDVSQWL
jgi:hypothetical protein